MSKNDSETAATEKTPNAEKAILDLRQSVVAAMASVERTAKAYAEMAPGRKPSYAGALLILGAVAMEVAKGAFSRFSFDNSFTSLMLVGGIVCIATGGILEAWLMKSRIAALEIAEEGLKKQLAETAGNKSNIWDRLIGKS